MVRTSNAFSYCLAFFVFLSVAVVPAHANTVELPDGSKLDGSLLCPVCNMRVDAGNIGIAAVVMDNGKVIPFDGPGDLFRFVLAPGKYGFDPGRIKYVFVTDYERKTLIDAKKGFYVVGSDLSGGMGPEAIPFSTKEAAEKFKADHKGKEVLSYGQVNEAHLKTRKKILKMDQGTGGGHGH